MRELGQTGRHASISARCLLARGDPHVRVHVLALHYQFIAGATSIALLHPDRNMPSLHLWPLPSLPPPAFRTHTL